MGEVGKLHHTVPKFYLRGFADHRAWITTVRLPGEKNYTQSIDKSAAIDHFYSIDGHPDGPDVFEKALSELERSAATVLRAIEAGEWPYVYRHPDDQAALPARLPEPRLSNLSIAGQGEPGFRLPAE